jgi:hypothetical protein
LFNGLVAAQPRYGVSRAGARLFATLDLATPIAEGVALAVEIRNSTDKSLPLGFCAGNRVFVCSNLAFHSELMVNRKHTRFGADRFREAIALAIRSLAQFQQVEAKRIETFRQTELLDVRAESLILRSFERGLVSSRQLSEVVAAYREPAFEEFLPRTLWSLLNAYTCVFGARQRTNPQRFAGTTMDLQAFLAAEMGLAGEPLHVTAV